MRILFIEPRVRNPVRLSVALPMTYLSLFSYVKAHIQDINISYYSLELDYQTGNSKSLESIYKEFAPNIVFMSAVSCNFSSAVEVLKYFKAKGVTTILGGIFATANDNWILNQHPFIDIIVRGEGEKVILDLLTSLKNGGGLSSIRSLSFMRGGMVQRNQRQFNLYNLDELPPINFSGIPIHLYKEYCSRYYVFASRGCKYDCDFCSLTRHWGRSQRQFSSERVLQEIKQLLHLFSPKQISFGDDTLDFSSGFYQELLTALNHHCFPVRFGGKTRIDLVDEKTIILLKKAGFSELSFGIESDDETQLKRLNKGSITASLAKLKPILKRASDEGFRVNLNFILGIAGETEITLRKKANFIIEHCSPRISNVIPLLAFLTPHPGTRLSKNLNQLGLSLIDNNYDHFTHLQPVCLPESLGAKGRSLLITTYNYISRATESEKYNPLLEE